MKITWEGIFKTLLILAIYLFLYFYQVQSSLGRYLPGEKGVLDTKTGDIYYSNQPDRITNLVKVAQIQR